MKFIFEQSLLEEYSNKLKQEFYDVFTNGDEKTGKELLDLFDKSKQLLLNNNISNNIQKWISDAKKDPSKVQELKNILHNLSTRQNRIDKGMDIRKRKVPGKYKELWSGDGKTLYRIDNVTASMALGVNTGWCTTGRYGHAGDPSFVPSKKDAEGHFKNHQDLQGTGIGKLYYLVDDNTGYGLYAWHFQANKRGKYSGYNKFDDKDRNVSGFQKYPPEEEIDKIAYEDFMGYIEDTVKNIPDFEVWRKVLKKYNGNSTKVVIPEGIVAIGESAFLNNTTITSVEIPESVIKIDASAFCGCSSLTKVTIPDGVEEIGGYAFSRCTSLTRLAIPDSVTELGECAFWGCTNLTKITLSSRINYIRSGAFEHCKKLTSIVIPEGMAWIGNFAFCGCQSLKSVTIPDSVSSIGASAFKDCIGLTKIKLPAGLWRISYNMFSGCTGIGNFVVPDGVSHIYVEAFEGCSNLTSISIPNSVRDIGDRAFNKCTSLQNVYYGGTEEEWDEIHISAPNTPLFRSHIHFR